VNAEASGRVEPSSNDNDVGQFVGYVEGLRDGPWVGETGGEVVVRVVSVSELEGPSYIARDNSNSMVYSSSGASCDVREQDVQSHHAFDPSSTRVIIGARQVQSHEEVLTDCGLSDLHRNRSQGLSGYHLVKL
jgi:hypothetical protein